MNAIRELLHDLSYRPTKIETAGIQHLSYLFDKNDNITRITNGIVANNTQTYAYDYLNRLTSTTSSSGNHSYTYDEGKSLFQTTFALPPSLAVVGNRKTHSTTGLNETYQYASNSNQLEKVIANGVHNNIAYNANGHTQTKDSGTFNYNAENRMSSFIKNGQTTSFTYNALGQRASKSGPYGTNHYLAGVCSRPLLHSRLPWRSYNEAGQLIAEHYSDGRVRKEYIYLQGQVIGFIAGSTPTLYYVHNDHLGRAERITDATKGTVWLANNHDFDRSIAQSIGDYNLGFPGQYFDKETGLYYNYFRDYDPKTGRYVQSDPIGLAAGVNTYGYVSGNPVKFIDIFGLMQKVCSCQFNAPSLPGGNSVDANITSGAVMGGGVNGLKWFYNQVRNKGPMDYKQYGSQYERAGNFNYGAVGRAVGFSRAVLLRGAGFAQHQAGTSPPNSGHYTNLAGENSTSYGDDPRDQVNIKQGIDYFDKGYYEVCK